MSSPKRRRALILAAGATVIAATVVLPQQSLSAGIAGVLTGMSSSSVTAPGDGGNTTPPITKVPANKPATGEIYNGLKPAKAKTACSGLYHVGASSQCTHGPDKAPKGLDVKKDVAPIAPAIQVAPAAPASAPAESAVALDLGGVPPADANTPAFVTQAAPGATAVGPNGVVCEGDGRTGKRVQVLYVREAGSADRFAQYAESFRNWAVGADAIYQASAEETGGVRHIRFVTTPDCKVDVLPVEVPAGAMADYGPTISALGKLGYNAKDRIYMIFGDAKVYCGIGSMKGDDKPGAANRSNTGPGYGRSDSGCWSSSVISHEFGHNLGAVNNSAPNSSKAGHCVDEYDIMCYVDAPGTVLKTVCTDKKHENRLDCGHDDYFNTNPADGSYLKTHWNIADNDFLIKGDSTTTPPPPNPSPTVSPTTGPPPPPKPSPTVSPTTGPPPPQPSPTATPNPGPTGTPTPGPSITPGPGTGLQPLTVTAKTSTSVSLTWPASAKAGKYGLVVNGRQLGLIGGTAVKLVGMRPGKTYQLQITQGGAPYSTVLSIVTDAASRGPVSGQWSVLTNAFTDLAVDLLGSRSAANTPAVAWPRHGYANQQWQAVPAGTGTVQLKSRASNKCLGAAGQKAVAGSGIVQNTCDANDASQLWKVVASEYGFTLTTAKGDLVLGAGTAGQGSARPLVLQRPTGARYQSWVVAAVKR